MRAAIGECHEPLDPHLILDGDQRCRSYNSVYHQRPIDLEQLAREVKKTPNVVVPSERSVLNVMTSVFHSVDQ